MRSRRANVPTRSATCSGLQLAVFSLKVRLAKGWIEKALLLKSSNGQRGNVLCGLARGGKIGAPNEGVEINDVGGRGHGLGFQIFRVLGNPSIPKVASGGTHLSPRAQVRAALSEPTQ